MPGTQTSFAVGGYAQTIYAYDFGVCNGAYGGTAYGGYGGYHGAYYGGAYGYHGGTYYGGTTVVTPGYSGWGAAAAGAAVGATTAAAATTAAYANSTYNYYPRPYYRPYPY